MSVLTTLGVFNYGLVLLYGLFLSTSSPAAGRIRSRERLFLPLARCF